MIMKPLKKATAILLLCLLTASSVLSVSAADQGDTGARAASRFCSRCGQMTPFVDCGTCDFLTQGRAPYHCHVCGSTYNTGTRCPGAS